MNLPEAGIAAVAAAAPFRCVEVVAGQSSLYLVMVCSLSLL